jgi:hypothetical protein
MIEVPSFVSPTPTKGPCVPELLPNPLDVESEVGPDALVDDPVVPDPLAPNEDDPNPEPVPPDEPNPGPPDAPEGDISGDVIPEELPNPEPSIPPSGLPKKPFTVVFASPRRINRQSSLPVIGSM